MRLSELAGRFAIRVIRNGHFESLGFVRHTLPHMLVFIETEAFLDQAIHSPQVACIIAPESVAHRIPKAYGVAVTDSPRELFYAVHNYLARETSFYWTDFETEIAPDAMVHERAYIAPRNVRIGRGTVVEPNATILERCIIGEDVVIRSGCTLGSQGFEFKRFGKRIVPVAHAGGVRTGDRVEIQANSAMDRSVFGGFTELGNDTKLDNLVHVAHNVRVGERCLIAAQVMIAGSVTVGNDVWIGPQAAISSEITIGDQAYITLGSVVTRDVEPNQHVTGYFAVEHQRFLRSFKAWLRPNG